MTRRQGPIDLLLWSPLRIQAEGVHRALSEIADVNIKWASNESEAIESLSAVDAAVLLGAGGGYSSAVSAAVRGSPRLRWVQIFSTGIDSLQAQGLAPNVHYSHIGDAATAVVAEHAIALLLALVRQLPRAIDQAGRREWNRSIATSMRSLEGMRVALVGCGAIGQGAARRARSFGMSCVGVNRSGVNPDSELFEKVVSVEQRHQLYTDCDAVIVSLPLTPQTRALIGASDWQACQRGVQVVSVGRGPVLSMADLVDALKTGQVSAAGLDVTDPEPLPADHPLWEMPNVLITPHVAGAGSAAAVARVCAIVADNVRRFRDGETTQLPLQLNP